MQQNADNYELFKRWIAHRIAKNKNVLIITLGSTGSGKSFSNLRILEDIDNQFNVDRAAFKPEEFMNIVDSGMINKPITKFPFAKTKFNTLILIFEF